SGWSTWGHTERPASVLEKSGPRQGLTSANPKGSTIRNSAHPTKISLRFLGSWRELESRERRDHIPVQMSELCEGKIIIIIIIQKCKGFKRNKKIIMFPFMKTWLRMLLLMLFKMSCK